MTVCTTTLCISIKGCYSETNLNEKDESRVEFSTLDEGMLVYPMQLYS